MKNSGTPILTTQQYKARLAEAKRVQDLALAEAQQKALSAAQYQEALRIEQIRLASEEKIRVAEHEARVAQDILLQLQKQKEQQQKEDNLKSLAQTKLFAEQQIQAAQATQDVLTKLRQQQAEQIKQQAIEQAKHTEMMEKTLAEQTIKIKEMHEIIQKTASSPGDSPIEVKKEFSPVLIDSANSSINTTNPLLNLSQYQLIEEVTVLKKLLIKKDRIIDSLKQKITDLTDKAKDFMERCAELKQDKVQLQDMIKLQQEKSIKLDKFIKSVNYDPLLDKDELDEILPNYNQIDVALHKTINSSYLQDSIKVAGDVIEDSI